jgi:hypothetical protein
MNSLENENDGIRVTSVDQSLGSNSEYVSVREKPDEYLFDLVPAYSMQADKGIQGKTHLESGRMGRKAMEVQLRFHPWRP